MRCGAVKDFRAFSGRYSEVLARKVIIEFRPGLVNRGQKRR